MDIYPLQHDINILHIGHNVNYKLHYERKSCHNLEGALASAVARVSELDAFVFHAASKGAHFFIGVS